VTAARSPSHFTPSGGGEGSHTRKEDNEELAKEG